MHPRPVLQAGRQRWCEEQPQALLSVQPHHSGGVLWTWRPLLWIPNGQAVHHHQAESGMKAKEGREIDVARRHGVIEIIRLVEQEETDNPSERRKKRQCQDYRLLCLLRPSVMSSCNLKSYHFSVFEVRVSRECVVFPSHQVIGLLPGKNGQAPFVTCGAKVIPFTMRGFM